MRFAITGHTGFKGAWFTLLLKQLGHDVSGFSISSIKGSLYDSAGLRDLLSFESFGDIRSLDSVTKFFKDSAPDVVVHFAAQSLVGDSYRNPFETFETNVMGTSNVLNSIRLSSSVRACLIATTDKVYLNSNSNIPFLESDPLGGSEPYGKSKAIADLISQYYLTSSINSNISIVRAGNVIGGGDINHERLLPELISNYETGNIPTLRYPTATRPWQHVLDCLNGYLACIQNTVSGANGDVWNVGPELKDHVSVKMVQEITANLYGYSRDDVIVMTPKYTESNYLSLNSGKLRDSLGWENKYSLVDSITDTVNWHKSIRNGGEARKISIDAVNEYLML